MFDFSLLKARLIRFLGLTILPILAGWLNDYILYAHLVDSLRPDKHIVPFLAVFDIVAKVLLSAFSSYFLIKISDELNEQHQYEIAKLLYTIFLTLLAVESAFRIAGTFNWMGSENMRHMLARSIGMEFNHWAMTPFVGFVVVTLGAKLQNRIEDLIKNYREKDCEETFN